MEENPRISHSSCLPFEWSEITPEIQIRAEKELHETDQKRKECLKEMKDLIKGKRSLKADTSDEFLLRFLRARKFNTKNAFSLLKSYYEHRVNYPSIYSDFTVKSCEKSMNSNLINYLPSRTSDDSAICIVFFGAWNPEEISFDELLRFNFLCQEKALQNPVSQICGVTSIIDFKGLSWSHLSHLNLRSLRCVMTAIQNCVPLRHRAIHVFNNPSLFSVLFTLVKPLLNPKFSKRIFFHGDSHESLHKHIPPSILPEEFGGTNGPFSGKQFYSELLESDNEFAELLNYGYISRSNE